MGLTLGPTWVASFVGLFAPHGVHGEEQQQLVLLVHHLQVICSPCTTLGRWKNEGKGSTNPKAVQRGLQQPPALPLVAAHCLQKLSWRSLRAAPGAGSQAPALLCLAEMPNCGERCLTRIITCASGRAHPQPARMLSLDAA